MCTFGREVPVYAASAAAYSRRRRRLRSWANLATFFDTTIDAPKRGALWNDALPHENECFASGRFLGKVVLERRFVFFNILF